MTAIDTPARPRLSTRRCVLFFGTLSLLMFVPQGRAVAQNSSGPMYGAAPADQPSQTAAQPPAARSTALIGGKPNLAGTWALNPDQSDNPMEKMREARQESGNGGGGGRGGFGGGMGGGGGMAGGGGYGGRRGGQNGANGQNRRGGMEAMSQLVIEQTPTSAKVSDSSGRLIAQYTAAPDQSGSQQPSTNSGANSSANSGASGDTNAAAPARWQDNKLVSTVQMRNGGTTTRTYEMSPDNKQLIVTTKIENERLKNPVTIRQVYDSAAASTGQN
ncbi:MAG TPA: hypothetical protein VG322_04745 [Candidatus Acidoferrales bacterium]|jgi:hypothetical protein|nr:hypothetical protein [Candidatus Acidoferrales bacterium]